MKEKKINLSDSERENIRIFFRINPSYITKLVKEGNISRSTIWTIMYKGHALQKNIDIVKEFIRLLSSNSN